MTFDWPALCRRTDIYKPRVIIRVTNYEKNELKILIFKSGWQKSVKFGLQSAPNIWISNFTDCSLIRIIHAKHGYNVFPLIITFKKKAYLKHLKVLSLSYMLINTKYSY